MTLSLRLAEEAQDDLFIFGLWIAQQSDRETATDLVVQRIVPRGRDLAPMFGAGD